MPLSTLEAGQSTLKIIERRHQAAVKILAAIRDRHIQESPPRQGPRFRISEAAALVNRSSSAIRMAESDGRLPPQPRNASDNREKYTLSDLNHMREIFGTRPWRDPDDPTVRLAIQNFKGGVGKSTTSVHLAQYLAIRGYRVLLVDMDAQASSTILFGYIPDQDLEETDTAYALMGQEDARRPIDALIRKTHYDGLHLLPANLKLYNLEYELAARARGHGFGVLLGLAEHLSQIEHRYDVIILDPPPALGMVSLSSLLAANALVIPMPPNIIDFASTTSFLGMLSETLQTISELAGVQPEYGFIQMLFNKSDEQRAAHREIVTLTNAVFQQSILSTEIKTSAEIDNATATLQSVYDMPGISTNHAVRKRCLKMLDAANAEIEKHIRSLWPNTPPLEDE